MNILNPLCGRKGQSRFVFTTAVFYVTLLVMLTGLGATFGGAEDILEFPTLPDIPNPAEDVFGLSFIFGFFILLILFVAWIGLSLTFLFQIVAFTFTDFIGFPLNVIIFLPLTIFMIYEVVGRMVRGSGG